MPKFGTYNKAMAIEQYFDPNHQQPDSAAPIVVSTAIKLNTPTLELTQNGQTAINAAIGAVDNAQGYILQISTSNTFGSILQSLYTTSLAKTISGLTANTLYYGRLQAIASGLINSNYVTDSVTTEGLPNVGPTVEAGNNAAVNLPTNSMALNGTASDADGTIASVLWSKVSGDASITITNATSLNATLNNPNEVAGAVVVKLTGTDDDGLSAEDTVTKTFTYVNPQVNAGADKNITLPTNSGTLTATATTGSYPIVSTVWSKVSGSGTITTGGAYSGLTQGISVFKVVVTDSKGVTAEDTVSINVAAAATIAYYGWREDNTTLTPSEIQGSENSVSFTSGATAVTADFSAALEPRYLWYAEPSSEPLKTKWQDTVNLPNNGNIGTEEDLYGAPVISGSFRFYITTYQTTAPNPIQFKTA